MNKKSRYTYDRSLGYKATTGKSLDWLKINTTQTIKKKVLTKSDKRRMYWKDAMRENTAK